MSQTDPIAELLTRIRNAARARHDRIEVAYSRIREAIARVLASEGFLAGVEIGGEGYQRKLLLTLKYSPRREPIIQGLERVSRPSLRRYTSVATMPRTHGALSVHILSTPLGVITDREARRRRVGGEILCRVW